ncbi:MAG TPA: hypothetical protein VMD99_15340 [Terriglobales bacterium]|nr:hypothetical protein [Terriglobales bacterium]
MNISDAMPESFEGQQAAPAAMAETRPMYWSVRRELWENRSIYIAPLTVGAVILVGFLLGSVHMAHRMREAALLGPEEQKAAIMEPYEFAAGLLMAAAMIVGFFYSLEALHGERRDRSILFWKSLPVSDLTTVLAKASMIAILQLITCAVIVATQWVMLLLNSAMLGGSGISVSTLWSDVSWFQLSLGMLYHLVTVHILWHAPLYAYLLLVSSWARRAAILWAGLPVLAVGVVEKIAFGSSHFANMLLYRLTGPEEFNLSQRSFHPMAGTNLVHFLSTPGLWAGLLVTAAFLVLAARVRRYRDPM